MENDMQTGFVETGREILVRSQNHCLGFRGQVLGCSVQLLFFA